VLIKTDFHHVIQLVHSPRGDDHTSIGPEAADIKRKYPAQDIDFPDDEPSGYLPMARGSLHR
jgi:hypothetical protein